MKPKQFLPVLLITIILSSCYSVRVSSRDGIPEKRKIPDISEEIYYKDKPYYVIDTTINQGVVNSDFTINSGDACPNGFYALEYRVKFSHLLLNFVTFGKVKKVKVKYVCIKEQS